MRRRTGANSCVTPFIFLPRKHIEYICWNYLLHGQIVGGIMGAVFDEVLSHATFRVAWCDGFIARAAWDHRFRSAHTNLWNEGTGRARGFRRFPHLSRRWLRGEIPGCFHDTEPREFPLDFVLWRPTCLREKVFSENSALRTHRQCNVAASACTMQFRLGHKRCTSSRSRVRSDHLSFRRVRPDSLSASISGSGFVR